MTDQQPRHVFISYVRENQEQVDRLCEDLEGSGVNVWLDRNSIKPGDRWKDAIREAIRHGDFFIACFSKEYTNRTVIDRKKSYMNEELTLATEELRQYASDREWFIPVLLSECDVPARSIGGGETLLDINWVPLYEDWDAGIQKILSVIKPTPPEIQNLISALRSEDRDVRDRAFKALHKIGDPSSVPGLIEALKDEDFRKTAARDIRKIGPEAKAAVPALSEVLKDKNKLVRTEATKALGKIGPEAKAAVPALSEALKDEYAIVRLLAADALGKIGPESKAAVPALVETLKDEEEDVRWFAAQALGYIGPEAKAAVPTLVDALEDESGNFRLFAAWALAHIIGLEAKAAVPALIEALKDKSKSVREQAAQALEKINTPEAQKALEDYKKKSE